VKEHRLTTTRRARYYTMGDTVDAADDIWFVVHGFGQLAGPFLRQFQRIARPRRLLVAPEALNRYYSKVGPSGTRADAEVGATWMTKEDRENEILDYVGFLDAVFDEVVTPGARVTVLGFSQGVATAARWLASGRGRADRFVAWAGTLPPDLALDRLAACLAGAPLILVTGSADQFASWVNLEENRARLHAAGIAFELLEFDGGHRLDDGILDGLGR
jgi:predicted esterase